MKTNSGAYTQAELSKRIFAIEDELTAYWKKNGYSVMDTEIQEDFRIRIEDASFGRNTVRYDAAGLPSILVKFEPGEEALLSYLYGDTTSGIHPAFNIDGVIKPWFHAKYLCGRIGSTNYAVSLRGLDPAHTINFDNSLSLCVNKGAGYSLASNAQQAYIALLSMRKGFQARGNTHYGRHHVQTSEYGIGALSSGDRYGRTLTGSGPNTWSHDGTPFGIFDMVGNVYKWAGGFRIVNGELQVMPQGNAAGSLRTLAAHGASSTDWKAITVAGAMVTPESLLNLWASGVTYAADAVIMSAGVRYKALSEHTSAAATEPNVGADWATVWVREGTLHYVWDGSIVKLADAALGLSEDSRSVAFAGLTAPGITPPDIVKQLNLFPKTAGGPLGQLYVRGGVGSERMPRRGGDWDFTSFAGLGVLNLNYGRSYSNYNIGLALAYQE